MRISTGINKFYLLGGLAFLLLFSSCAKESGVITSPPNTLPPPGAGVAKFDINSINDTYSSLADFSNYTKWGSYNVHDPAIIKEGDWYYCYSTDAGYGIDVRSGIQVRKSKDLVEWTFVGWVFNALPRSSSDYISANGGKPFNSLWAPCIVKAGTEFRLYYSHSSPVMRLSAIGLATSSSPEGPWVDKGLVVSSANDNSVQTNAIDPSVVISPSGEHWMVYGSAWDGIYALQLNSNSGFAMKQEDKGRRIANRGFTNGLYNGNIEAADIVYNAGLNKYFLFISYDWLETKYNVRVMRGDKPNGPFFDYKNSDANQNVDHLPMIIAPYQFDGHSGWQGVGHSATFSDGAGNWFIAHQGRPGVDKYFMNLHIRRLYFSPDGWPVASPQRFAWEKDSTISKNDIAGSWEQIILGYTIVPGYAAEQTSSDFQTSRHLEIGADGTLNGNAANTWTYDAPWLTMKWANGFTDKVIVQKGRDWENKKNTLIFTGLNNEGTSIWGKKK